jgi:HEAT repeat protein
MRRRRLLFFAAALLVSLVAAVLIPDSRCILRGWLHGENRYRGLPTSYWRLMIQRWDRAHPDAMSAIAKPEIVDLTPTWLERLLGIRREVEEPPLGLGVPAVAPVALELLSGEDGMTPFYAFDALHSVSSPDVATVQALGKALRDGNRRVRGHAEILLQSWGPKATPAMPALLAALGDDRPDVRRSAARVLERMGPAAQPAVPALRRLLQDENREVRRAATEALCEIDAGMTAGGMPAEDEEGNP